MSRRVEPFWVILFLWIIALVIINPIGDFPLNDDWIYGWSVREWLKTGKFQMGDLPLMSLFSHVVWGTFWTKLFGFSFTALRFSIILLSVISIWIFSRLLKALNYSWEQRLLALAIIVFNPMYFHLSVSFMTDISFLSFCIISTYGFWRYFSSENWYWWAFAIFFSILAILVRQLGVLIPMAFGGAIFFRKRSIKTFLTAAAGVLLTYGSLKIYMFCLENTTGLSSEFKSIDSVYGQLRPSVFWARTKDMLGFYFIYLGGYLLPIWIFTTKRLTDRMYLGLFFLGLPILGFFTWSCWDRLPLWNTVYDLGIGPMNLTDFIRGYSNTNLLSHSQGLLIKLAGYLGAILLLWNGVQGIKRIWINRKMKSSLYFFKLGVLFFLFSYITYLIIDRHNFDRYMLPLIPFTLLLLPRSEGGKWWPSLIILIPIFLFTIGGTHDYFAWNKARWNALNDLTAEGVSPNEIDGGYEFNGWYQTHDVNPNNRFSKSWWFVDDDQYAIAFTTYKNYEVIKAYPFKSYLSFGVDTVYTLNRPGLNRSTIISDTKLLGEDSLFVRYKKENYLTKNLPEHFEQNKSSSIYHIKKDQTYSFSHRLFPVKPFEKISITYELYGDKKSFRIVNSAPKADDFYFPHLPFVVKKDKDNWQKMAMEMEIPFDYPSDTLNIYFWKQKKDEEIFIRDLNLEWKRF